MLENQVKNTIKTVLATLAVTIVGEGVLGIGAYWPFLILLVDWDGVFWLAVGIGVLVSVFNGLPIGLPSLLLVVFTAIFSVIFGGRRDMPLIAILAIVIANVVFDKLLGLGFSVSELFLVGLLSLFVLGRGEKNDSIQIRYR